MPEISYKLMSRAVLSLVALTVLPGMAMGCEVSSVKIDDQQQVTPADKAGSASERVVMVWGYSWYTDTAQTSPLDFIDWRKQNTVFKHIAAFVGGGLNLTKNGVREVISRTSVSADFFDVLGTKPALGRAFTLDDEKSGNDDVVILSHALWERHFNSDPNIVGKKVFFNTEEMTVVGVMPPGFRYPGATDLPPDFKYQPHTDAWTPLAFDGMNLGRGFRFLSVIGRLRAGVSLKQAQSEMDAIVSRLQQKYPQTNKKWEVRLVPLKSD